MATLTQAETKRLVAVHGWSGVLLGLLLYAVVLTGAVALFAEEIGDWSAAREHVSDSWQPGIGRTVDRLAAETDPAFLEEISLVAEADGLVRVFLHTHRTDDAGQLAEFGRSVLLDPASGTVIADAIGWGADLREADAVGALRSFLVDLHVRLHLPNPWGLLLTGILGLAMMVAAVSGILMHRHLFAELFTLRRSANSLLGVRDRHSVAGSWSLPYAFILAFTGAFFSFAGSFGLPALAMVAFGGDQEQMIRTLVASPPAADETPALMAKLDVVLTDAAVRGEGKVVSAFVSHYGRADAQVNVFVAPRNGVGAEKLLYAGDSGEFLGVQALVGTAPSVGATVLSFMGPLHFGNFAGLASKLVWLALGFATCYVVITGILLWLRRREQSPRWRVLQRLTTWVGYGLPLSMLASGFAYFGAVTTYVTAGPVLAAGAWSGAVPTAFVVVAMLLLGPCLAVPWRMERMFARMLLGANGLALLTLPVARLLCGGTSWPAALASGDLATAGIDAVLVAGGATCLVVALRGARQALAGVRTSLPVRG